MSSPFRVAVTVLFSYVPSLLFPSIPINRPVSALPGQAAWCAAWTCRSCSGCHIPNTEVTWNTGDLKANHPRHPEGKPTQKNGLRIFFQLQIILRSNIVLWTSWRPIFQPPQFQRLNAKLQGGHGIQEAGRQAAQASVAQRGIRLFGEEILQKSTDRWVFSRNFQTEMGRSDMNRLKKISKTIDYEEL